VSSEKDLIEYILAANEASLNAVKSISYRFKVELSDTPRRGFPFKSTRHGTYARNAAGEEFIRLFKTTPIIDQTGKLIGTTDTEERSVIAARYAAGWTINAITPAVIWDHDSPTAMTQRAEERVLQDWDRRFHLYAFGDGKQTIRTALLKRDPRIITHVSAPDATTDRFYRLRVGASTQSGREQPLCCYWFDATQGFLLVRFEAYVGWGDLGIRIDIEPKEDTSRHIWYPATINYIEYRRWRGQARETKPDDGETQSKRFAELTDFKLADAWPTTQFTIKALEMPDGTAVIHVNSRGQRTTEFAYDSDTVPQEVAETTGVRDIHDKVLARKIAQLPATTVPTEQDQSDLQPDSPTAVSASITTGRHRRTLILITAASMAAIGAATVLILMFQRLRAGKKERSS
jgi:hypothetical protein